MAFISLDMYVYTKTGVRVDQMIEKINNRMALIILNGHEKSWQVSDAEGYEIAAFYKVFKMNKHILESGNLKEFASTMDLHARDDGQYFETCLQFDDQCEDYKYEAILGFMAIISEFVMPKKSKIELSYMDCGDFYRTNYIFKKDGLHCQSCNVKITKPRKTHLIG